MTNASTERTTGSTQTSMGEDIDEDDDEGTIYDIKEVDEVPAFPGSDQDNDPHKNAPGGQELPMDNPQYGHGILPFDLN